MTSRPAIPRMTVVQLVTDRIREDILSGALAPGEKVVVPALGQELGVSHIPIREALRGLEAESLVESRPGHSVVVAGVDSEELHELYSLRRLLEGDLIARAFPHYTPAYVDAIDEKLDELKSQEPSRRNDAWWVAHRDFHWAFLEPASGKWQARLLRLVWQSVERYQRRFSLMVYPLDNVHAQHTALIHAARTDAAALAASWSEELQRSERSIAEGYRLVQEASSSPSQDGDSTARTARGS